MCSPYPEFVLTGVIYIENALKGTEIVFVLTVFVLTRFCIPTQFRSTSFNSSSLYKRMQVTSVNMNFRINSNGPWCSY